MSIYTPKEVVETSEELMKGFVPRFGSDTDLSIASALGEIKKLEQFIDKQTERKNEIKTISKTLRAKTSELNSKKQHLLNMLQKRRQELSIQ